MYIKKFHLNDEHDILGIFKRYDNASYLFANLSFAHFPSLLHHTSHIHIYWKLSFTPSKIEYVG